MNTFLWKTNVGDVYLRVPKGYVSFASGYKTKEYNFNSSVEEHIGVVIRHHSKVLVYPHLTEW